MADKKTNTTTAKTKTKTAKKNKSCDTPIETKPVNNIDDSFNVNLDELIPVYNGFHGVLVYASKKTGEIYQWDNFGDIQDMELKELKTAKSASKDFFINNWFMFDEEHQWVIDYLGVGQFYKNAISLDGFDDILTLSPDEIKKTVTELSEGQKDSLVYMVKNMVANDEIDSLKTLSALEESLGVTLVEKF